MGSDDNRFYPFLYCRISTECPRSPSPDPEPNTSTPPKLIPVEKQKSLLDLPMPEYEGDEEPTVVHQSSFWQKRPPQHQSSLPNPIARLIEGVHKSTIAPMAAPPMPNFFCGSSDIDLRLLSSSDDIDMREAPVETFEPRNFEEVPSPPRLELDLKSDDDDDLVIDESHTSPKETEKQQLPPPVEPLKPPPRPPSLLNLGQTDLESLAQSAPSTAREQPLEQEMKGPADDFIPGRQISRVPSGLMASRTGNLTMPSPRPMASPRPKPSSVRIPPSPAYESQDLFTPDPVVPKYQQFIPLPPQRPVQVCIPVSRHAAPAQPPEMPPPAPISLPDFVPPSSVTFQPPQRPANPNQWGQNRDPRAAVNQDYRDPRRMAQDRPMPDPHHRPGHYGAPSQMNHDPRLQNRSHVRPVAIVPSVDRQGQYVPHSYREHRRLKELERKRQADQRRKEKQEVSLWLMEANIFVW